MAENQLIRFKHSAALLIFVTVLAVFSTLWNGDLLKLHDDVQLELAQNQMKGKSGFAAPFASNYQPGDYYRPLTGLSHFFDISIGTNPASTARIVNIFLHALCCVVLYYVLLSLGISIELSFWAVLIFGVHPIQAGVVSWISSRGDLLAGVFTALTLKLFVEYLRQRRKITLAFAAAAIFAGIMCKEHVILLPFLLFVFLGLRLKIKENFNEIITGAIILSVPVMIYASIRAIISSVIKQPSLTFAYGYRNINQLTEPLSRFFFPDRIYSLPTIDREQALIGSAALLILPVLGYWLYRKKGIFTFLIAPIWYLVFSIPGIFSSNTFSGTACYWDCRAYVPLFGLLFPIATAFELLYVKIRDYTTPVLMTIIIALCVFTLIKSSDYYSGEEYWKSVIREYPGQPVGYLGLFKYSLKAEKPKLADTIGIHIYETFPDRPELLNEMSDNLERECMPKLAVKLLIAAEPDIRTEKLYTALIRNIVLSGDFHLLQEYASGKYYNHDGVIKDLTERANTCLKEGKPEQRHYLLLGKRLLDNDTTRADI